MLFSVILFHVYLGPLLSIPVCVVTLLSLFHLSYAIGFILLGKCLLSDGTALFCIAVAAGFSPKCFPENCLPRAKIVNQNRCFTYVLQAWKPSFLCHVYWAQLFTFSMKKSK